MTTRAARKERQKKGPPKRAFRFREPRYFRSPN